MPDDMNNIQITPTDMSAVIQADPMVAEKVKNAALIRMLGWANKRVENLEAKLAELEPSTNGTSEEPVPEAVTAKKK
jgi:hypothetical protein